MEKIIVAYVCAMAVFVTSITAGTGLLSQLAGNQPDDPEGTAVGNGISTGIAGPQEPEPAVDLQRILRGDQEGVAQIRENKDFPDELREQIVYRIHNDALDGQEDYQVYESFGDYPAVLVYSARTDVLCTLTTAYSVPTDLYDAVVDDLNSDGVYELILSAKVCLSSEPFSYEDGSDKVESTYIRIFDGSETEVASIACEDEDILLFGVEKRGELPVYRGTLNGYSEPIEGGEVFVKVTDVDAKCGILTGKDRNYTYEKVTVTNPPVKDFYNGKIVQGDKLGVDFEQDDPANVWEAMGITDTENLYRVHGDLLDGSEIFAVYQRFGDDPCVFVTVKRGEQDQRTIMLRYEEGSADQDGYSYSSLTAIRYLDAAIADLNEDGEEELILCATTRYLLTENGEPSSKDGLYFWVIDVNDLDGEDYHGSTVDSGREVESIWIDAILFGEGFGSGLQVHSAWIDRSDEFVSAGYTTLIGYGQVCGTLDYRDGYVYLERPLSDEVVTDGGLVLRLTRSGDAYYIVTYLPGDTFPRTEDLIIPESYNGLPITGIGTGAFRDSSLKRLSIPESITDIGSFAFMYSSYPIVIYYGGSEEDWAAIRIGTPNEVLASYTIHYGISGLPGPLVDVRTDRGLVLRLTESGNSYYVVSFGSCTDNEIVIPESWNGLPITEIGAEAFSACYHLTDITIPQSVVKIGKSAFRYCSGLTSIVIPKSVTEISENVFDSCTYLSSFSVEKGNPVYHSAGNCLIETESKTLVAGFASSVIPTDGSVKIIGPGAFDGQSLLKNLVIPEGIVSIKADAFRGCFGLTEMVIPEGVTEIGNYAFAYCRGLKKIHISGSVKTIGDMAIYYCNALEKITVAESNTVYHAPGYCLISKSDKVLLAICKYSVLPGNESIRRIGKYAFVECGRVAIAIPDGVRRIEESAFASCGSVRAIAIPESVNYIASFAFSGCSNLTDVYYGGTEEQWKKIQIVGYNSEIKEATVHFGTTEIPDMPDDPGEPPETVEPTEPVLPPESTTVPPTRPTETEAVTEEGLSLRLADFGDFYCVVGIGSFKGSDLVIPSSYNGYPIGMIAAYAFEGCEGLVSVTISEGIFEIGSGAFQNIGSLVSVTIPSTVGTVGNNAFRGCVKLQNVSISQGVLRYGAAAFYGCKSLKTITIPRGAEMIGERIFDGCDALTDVYYGGSQAEWKYAAYDVMPPAHTTLHFAE